MDNTNKILIAVLGALILAAGVWYFAFYEGSVFKFNKGPEKEGETIAIVNGEEITSEEFEALKLQVALQQGLDIESIDSQTEAQLDEQVMDELISKKLLMQEIERLGLTVPQETVDEQLNALKGQFESEEVFQQVLAMEGLSEEELRAQIEADLAIQNYLESQLDIESITVTEEEIEAAYQQVAGEGDEVPPLEEVYDEVEQFVVQQKQQEMVYQLIQGLRAEADIEIMSAPQD